MQSSDRTARVQASNEETREPGAGVGRAADREPGAGVALGAGTGFTQGASMGVALGAGTEVALGAGQRAGKGASRGAEWGAGMEDPPIRSSGVAYLLIPATATRTVLDLS